MELSFTLPLPLMILPSKSISLPSDTITVSLSSISEQLICVLSPFLNTQTSLFLFSRLFSRSSKDFFCDQWLNCSPSSSINIIELAIPNCLVNTDMAIALPSKVSMLSCPFIKEEKASLIYAKER